MNIIIAIIIALIPMSVSAQTVPVSTSTAVLTWDSNTEPDMASYVMLMGTVAGVYTKTKPITHVLGVPTQTGELSGLLEGQTYFFSVKACDLSGNCSTPATPVSGKVLIPPGTPSGLGVKIKINITIDVP